MRRLLVPFIVSACAFVAIPAVAEAGTVKASNEWCGPSWCEWSSQLKLIWTGAPGEANDVTIARSSDGGWTLTERGSGAQLVADSPECTVVERTATCGQTPELIFDAGDGDDVVSTDASDGSDVDRYDYWFSERMFGGPGNDVLDGGEHGCCVGVRLVGGPGDDRLSGGPGGYDVVDYTDATSPLDVSLLPRPPGARNGAEGERDVIAEDVEDIWGGQAGDTLTGDHEPNQLYGGSGFDVIGGNGGNDYLYSHGSGWDPPDNVYGGDGDDWIMPGPRVGIVEGGAGRDELSFANYSPSWFMRISLDGQANDGGVGSEDFTQGRYTPRGNVSAVETVYASRVSDLLIGDDAANWIYAGGGNDVIDARGGADVVYADQSWDYDADGDDFVYVLDGEIDQVVCRGGTDVVIADPDDELADDCEQRSSDPVPLPDVKIDWPPPQPAPPPGTGWTGWTGPPPTILPEPVPGAPPPNVPPPPDDGPTCVQVGGAKNAVRFRLGSQDPDCLVGGKRADWLDGRLGADRLLGESGADRLMGGRGDDWIDGGGGADRLDGGPGTDLVLGSAGKDTLAGGTGEDSVIAADGSPDRVDCGKGQDNAVVDKLDRVKNCEVVSRTKRTGR